MSGTASNRIPAGQVVLILVVLLAVWLGFLYWPTRKEAPPSMAPVKAESKLQAVGLTDNPDWEGMPELFAIWVGQIPWINDRTCFAYWHSGATAYAYFFEATRGAEGVRFRSVGGRGAMHFPTGTAGESLSFDDDELARYAEERRAGSPTHPFVFPRQQYPDKPSVVVPDPERRQVIHQVPLDSTGKPFPPPAIDPPKPPNVGSIQ